MTEPTHERPVEGIVDVVGSNAFLRTDGYAPGQDDIHIPPALVRQHGLRRGDEVVGVARPRDEQPNQRDNHRDTNRDNYRDNHRGNNGSRRDKHDPLVRVSTVNGRDPRDARRRPDFYDLTPLFPQERLRLESEPHQLITRVIDLVMPIGKGQRALVVAPPKAGKTTVLQSIANAVSRNNPEAHLMVVLVDERPEEVTDMQRSTKGEVIASTFDRPPAEHCAVAELAIERAKRLVELGQDVVVILDSITRLGRAYNNSAPASGRILTGGIDAAALYPPKRFLGAARNVEDGGSLTIIASVLVETGSAGDTVIFEEFKGTSNAELRLDRKLADKRLFPAVDIDPSGTRMEEILLAPDERVVVTRLRKALSAMGSERAIEQLLDQLKATGSNAEFLFRISRSAG